MVFLSLRTDTDRHCGRACGLRHHACGNCAVGFRVGIRTDCNGGFASGLTHMTQGNRTASACRGAGKADCGVGSVFGGNAFHSNRLTGVIAPCICPGIFSGGRFTVVITQIVATDGNRSLSGRIGLRTQRDGLAVGDACLADGNLLTHCICRSAGVYIRYCLGIVTNDNGSFAVGFVFRSRSQCDCVLAFGRAVHAHGDGFVAFCCRSTSPCQTCRLNCGRRKQRTYHSDACSGGFTGFGLSFRLGDFGHSRPCVGCLVVNGTVNFVHYIFLFVKSFSFSPKVYGAGKPCLHHGQNYAANSVPVARGLRNIVSVCRCGVLPPRFQTASP